MSARLAAENTIFMLQADQIGACGGNDFRGPSIVANDIFADFELRTGRIIVPATGRGHRDHAGLQVRAGRGDSEMQIVRESRDSALAWQVAPHEREVAKWRHAWIPLWGRVNAVMARAKLAMTCSSWGSFSSSSPPSFNLWINW